jgi:hypothetical protein
MVVLAMMGIVRVVVFRCRLAAMVGIVIVVVVVVTVPGTLHVTTVALVGRTALVASSRVRAAVAPQSALENVDLRPERGTNPR